MFSLYSIRQPHESGVFARVAAYDSVSLGCCTIALLHQTTRRQRLTYEKAGESFSRRYLRVHPAQQPQILARFVEAAAPKT